MSNCPRCTGLLITERDNITCDAYLTKDGYHYHTRGFFQRCVNCGYQSDQVMEKNKHAH